MAVSEQGLVPSALRAYPSFPNPFRAQTFIRYDLAGPAAVDLRIYDISGRLVRVLEAAGAKGIGEHRVVWDGRNDRGHRLAAGVYLYRLEVERYNETHRMVLSQ